jgi:hypothetical protein
MFSAGNYGKVWTFTVPEKRFIAIKTIEVINKVTHRRKTPFYEIRMPQRQKQSRFSAGWKSQCKNVKVTFFRTAGKKRRV